MRPPRRTRLAGPIAVLLVTAGCSSGGAGAACGPILREGLDPSYLVHVLGSETEVEYRSDPPTSGPHQPGPPIEGAVDRPLRRPVQVGLLEQGDVLLQHRSDLDVDALEELQALAGAGVVVAPNDDLDDPVVATAWLHKRTCGSVDVGALTEFIEERQGRGPDDG